MTAAWPDTLPVEFARVDFRQASAERLARFRPDNGREGRRPRGTTSVTHIDGTMLMTPDQWRELRAFWLGDLKGGAGAFMMPYEVPAQAGEPALQFVTPPSRTRQGAYWAVRLSLCTDVVHLFPVPAEEARVSATFRIPGLGRSEIEVVNPTGVRLESRLALEGLGAWSGVSVIPPVYLASALALRGLAASRVQIAAPAQTRIAGALEVGGLGQSSVTVARGHDVRMDGELALAGLGLSSVTVGEPAVVRLEGQLTIAGLATVEVVVENPAAVRLSGAFALLGLGSSTVTIEQTVPVRIAGGLEIAGLGMSTVNVADALGDVPNWLEWPGLGGARLVWPGDTRIYWPGIPKRRPRTDDE